MSKLTTHILEVNEHDMVNIRQLLYNTISKHTNVIVYYDAIHTMTSLQCQKKHMSKSPY